MFASPCASGQQQEESVLLHCAFPAEHQSKLPCTSAWKPRLAVWHGRALPTIPHPHLVSAEIVAVPGDVPSVAWCLLQTSQHRVWLCCSPCSCPGFTPPFMELKGQQRGSPMQGFRRFLSCCCNKSFTPTPSSGVPDMRRNPQGARKKHSLALTCWWCGFSVTTCDLNYHRLCCRRDYWKTDSFAGKRNQTGGQSIY